MTADVSRYRTGRRVRHAPWSAEQAARLIVSNLVALAGILATAYGAASTDATQTALLWLNLCIAALAFAGISNALWLVRCHNTASTWRADVLDDVADTIRLPEAAGKLGLEGYVVVTGLRRYHVAGCAFASGRNARPATTADLSSDRYTPCEVCVR
jgi:hypothetical protein